MKHISKLLVLVLALVMVLSVFAGCADTKPTTAPTKAPTTQTQAPSTNETEAPAQEGRWPLAERKTYKIYVMTANDWQTNFKYNGWYQELVERTNVEIEFIPLGSDKNTASQTLNAAFLSGDYGHAYIGCILTQDQVVAAADGGYLKDLTPFMTEDIMPGYMAVLPTINGAQEAMRCTDGKIYTMARLMNQGINGNIESPLLVNQHWLKAAGLDDVSTLAKFEQYLKYVKENDCNGNGDPNDEIPFLVSATSSLEAQATLQGIMNWWGIPTKDSANDMYIVITNGKVEIGPEMPAYRAALTKVKEWIDAGYIWDQFFTGKAAAMKSLLLDSEVPVVGCMNTNAYEPFDSAKYGDSTPNNGKVDDGYYDFETVPAVEGYTARMFLNPGYLGYRDSYAILGNTSDEDAEILLAWMDTAMWTAEGSSGATGEYWDQDKYIEGWHNTHKKEADGTIVKIELTQEQIESNQALEKTLTAGRTLYNICGSYTYCRPWSYYEEVPTRIAMRFRLMGNLYDDVCNKEVWARPYKTPDQADEISFLWPDVKSVITQYETDFLQGKLEINDANWQAYQKALYKAGSKDLVEIIQDVVDSAAGK